MNWTVKTKLSREDIATILDALSDQRDPFGEEAGDLEMRLQDLLHRCDKQIAERSR